MSQAHLDLARRGLDAYQRRDVRSMANVAHAQCEVFTFTGGVLEACSLLARIDGEPPRPIMEESPRRLFGL